MVKALLSLWRRAPAPVRRFLGGPLRRAWLRFAGSPAPALDKPHPGPLSIAGYFRATSGLAEGGRRQRDLLTRLGFAPVTVDLTEAIIPDRATLAPSGTARTTVPGPGGAVIMNVNPPELAAALSVSGVAPDVYRIGYWAWELEEAPAEWGPAARLVNEVWVPSAFCAKAIRKLAPLPVHVLPHPISVSADVRGDPLPATQNHFTVLFAYDALSSHARKNPEAVVEAFRRGLDGVADARLILKVSNLNRYPAGREILRAAIGGDTRITIVEEVLAQSDMDALLHSADVVLSLHRAEGFGLLLLQAMLAGKAVIATGWSGNCDFMDARASFLVPYTLTSVSDPQGLYRGGRWAEPDTEVAAQHLRACYEDRMMLRAKGQAAREKIRDSFIPAVEQRFVERLHELGFSSSNERNKGSAAAMLGSS